MPGQVDRRSFLAGGSGAFLCTLAGQEVLSSDGSSPTDLKELQSKGFASKNGQLNLEKLSKQVPVPSSVASSSGLKTAFASSVSTQPVAGSFKEYWIRAEPARWTIVPKRRDEMMNKRLTGDKFKRVTFNAYVYRAYEPGFAKPLGPATIPGPLIEGTVGESIVINFQNQSRVDGVTMHPHGVFYTEDMDGAYKGKYTPPGGFIKNNATFRYVWECREGTEGAWLYHDHGAMEPNTLKRGLFGPLIVRKAGEPKPDVEHFLFLHRFTNRETGLEYPFECINGRSYTGNTPNLRARVGQTVAQYVYGIDDNFHTYHLHGHRWRNAAGELVDNQTLGPGDVLRLKFVEDNPGRWFYHCHVFSHLHMGMSGWYIVDR